MTEGNCLTWLLHTQRDADTYQLPLYFSWLVWAILHYSSALALGACTLQIGVCLEGILWWGFLDVSMPSGYAGWEVALGHL